MPGSSNAFVVDARCNYLGVRVSDPDFSVRVYTEAVFVEGGGSVPVGELMDHLSQRFGHAPVEMLEITDSGGSSYAINALVGGKAIPMGLGPADSERGAVKIAESAFKGGVYPVSDGIARKPGR
jgi:hypothetical protein